MSVYVYRVPKRDNYVLADGKGLRIFKFVTGRPYLSSFRNPPISRHVDSCLVSFGKEIGAGVYSWPSGTDLYSDVGELGRVGYLWLGKAANGDGQPTGSLKRQNFIIVNDAPKFLTFVDRIDPFKAHIFAVCNGECRYNQGEIKSLYASRLTVDQVELKYKWSGVIDKNHEHWKYFEAYNEGKIEANLPYDSRNNN